MSNTNTDPKTVSAHNAELIGKYESPVEFANAHAEEFANNAWKSILEDIHLEDVRQFVSAFKRANQDIQMSDVQWTKLIDALVHYRDFH